MTPAGIAVRGLPARGLAPATALALLAIPVLALAAGWRWWGPGLDYSHYLSFWESFESLEVAGQSRFEPGYVVAAWAAKAAGLDYPAFHALLAAFSLSLKFAFLLRWTRHPALGFLAYVLLFYGVHEYTQIRQAVAIALGLMATSAWLRGRWAAAALWLLAGATFQSSVLALALGFGAHFALGRPWLLAPIALGALVALPLLGSLDPVFLAQRFAPIAVAYLEDPMLLAPQTSITVQNLAVMAVLLLALPRLLAGGESIDRLAFVMLGFSLVFWFVLADVPVLSGRLFEMFAVFLTVLAFRVPRPTLESLAMPLVLAAGVWNVNSSFAAGIYG